MRKGFTKIPNLIMELPWGNNPVIVYLYTWLSLKADKDGNVRMSLNEISSQTGLNKMQVRRAIEKMKVTQVVTQVATQPATQVPNTITVCYLSASKDFKTQTDTSSDIGNDIGSDTPRAYKNDNNISCLIEDVSKNSSSLRSEPHSYNSAHENFVKWLKDRCPYIYEHCKILSEEEFLKLKEDYTSQQIADTCENIENRKDKRKNYSNLYRTLINWLKRDYGTDNTRRGNTGYRPTHADYAREAELRQIRSIPIPDVTQDEG